MTTTVKSIQEVERDAEGFLVHSDEWSKELAGELARESGVRELTPRHWQVITPMRAAFLDHGALPWVRTLAAMSGLPEPELYDLFPHAPSHLVSKIAGIPKNQACI